VPRAGLSLRSNFAWVLCGNMAYAGCQWGMIVALAKLGSTFMVGQFALGLAIAVPVLMFANLNLRAVQATDARRLYSFGEYLRLRILTTTAALAVIAAVVWFGRYERRTAMVILALAAAKGIETLSDIHYGLFQLNDRLDQTGRSMMLRGVLSLIALSAGLYFTHSVLWGCVALALVWLPSLLLFDVRNGRRFLAGGVSPTTDRGLQRQWRLMRLALPLGIVTTLAALNLNMPRYFIHAWMGEHQLGIFSAMAYATVAMTLISDSLGHCAIPRLSRVYASGRLAEFRMLLFKMLAAGGALGLAGLAAATLLGSRLLTLVYSREYAAYSRVFILLMLAAAIHCAACMFTSGITSARCFRIQVPLYGMVAGSSALACARWVPANGLAGGAAAMVVGASVHFVLGAAIMSYLLWTAARRAMPPFCVSQLEPGV
jgi:O-antigen/teichoic acid export membrane protein